MRRRFFIALVLTLPPIVPLLGAAGSAQAATAWSPTSTQAMRLANARLLGALPASAPLHIVVGLAVRNQAGLQQYVRSVETPGNPLYGRVLSPAQTLAAYGPSAAQVRAVASYLAGHGFTNLQAEPNNLLISAHATAAQADAAFNTQIDQFVQQGKVVYANVRPAQVPSTLHGVVVAVLGLTNVGRMTMPHLTRPAPHADGALQVDDMIFNLAAAQGQTIDASSGDTGSACAVLPTNGLHCAKPGYDFVTGLGSFDVTPLNAAIGR